VRPVAQLVRPAVDPAPLTPGQPAPLLRRLVPRRLDTPLTSYYLVLGSTAALVVIGLVMVLSSSSVDLVRTHRSAYDLFSRQLLFAVLGAVLMLLGTRMTPRRWRSAAWPLVAAALVGQLLVFSPLGITQYDNRNWVGLGSFTLQPSEAGKLALVVWAAAVLAQKRALLHHPMHALVPVLPGAGLLLGLVLLGNDLGTAMVIMLILGALLFVAGLPLRLLGTLLGSATLLVTLMVLTSDNRMHRILNWGSTTATDPTGAGWQAQNGKFALATGGWWGVGLGSSRQKWGLLPEAQNDFIFAIIGEELGLIGTLAVLGLFVMLTLGLSRVVLRSADPFVKVATAGVLTWVIGQAIINVGAVLGVFPIVGLPLPLISSGGSALMTTMAALGMVVAFARHEPGAAEALAARASLVRRSLAVLPTRREGGA
jgi:cell division protein FtsW